MTGGKKNLFFFFIVPGSDLHLGFKASTSNALCLEGHLGVLLLLSVCICVFLVCSAGSLRYKAFPGEECANTFKVQKDSKSFCAGRKSLVSDKLKL